MSVPNLNLINFEHPASKKSSFILTSPKSLRACQKAGIKVEHLRIAQLKFIFEPSIWHQSLYHAI